MSIQKKPWGIFIPPKDEDELNYTTLSNDKKVYDNNNDGCHCWLCNDLEKQIKSLQKAQARMKQDTNKILAKIAKLESFFQ